MNAKSLLSAVAAASLALTAMPALADESASSSSSSSVSSRDAIRVERCKRFGDGNDYERCVRLIRRIPLKDNVETVDLSEQSGDQWKWTHFLNKIEGKVKGTIKYVSTMAKLFCKDRTEDTDSTNRECMARVKNELKTRIDAILDEVFRADLPSAR